MGPSEFGGCLCLKLARPSGRKSSNSVWDGSITDPVKVHVKRFLSSADLYPDKETCIIDFFFFFYLNENLLRFFHGFSFNPRFYL